MRTKSLLLAAVALAAGVITSQAQSVYSANIVGYVNQTVPASFKAIANPLVVVNGSNTNLATDVLPNLPDLSAVYIWNGSSYTIYGVYQGQYYDQNFNGVLPTPTLNVGEAFFVQSSAAFTNTFVGTVAVQSGQTNTMNLSAGFNFISPVLPEAGGVTSVLGLNPPDLSAIYIWNGSSFSISGYYQGQWYDQNFNGTVPEPTLTVGQGFFLQLPSAYSWSMSLTNN